MENNVLNNLQIYRGKWFSDLVTEDKLSNAFLTKPHEIPQIISYAFGTKNMGYGTSIDFLTGGLGKTETIQSRMWEWAVALDSDRAVTIHQAYWNGAIVDSTVAASGTPGLGGGIITLWLEDKWFGPGAIIQLDDRDFQLRVQSAPTEDGKYSVYQCVVADGQSASYIPGEYLLPGAQVSRLASAYEEYSDEADIINYSTNVKLRNCLTTLRLSYDITGSAYSTVLAVEMLNPETGKKSFLWDDYQVWVAMREWYKRLENHAMYSKTSIKADGTTDLIGTNGRPVYIGAGILQQISPANIRNYTTFSTALLEEFLFDLSYNILGSNERKFVALTGEMGMREFDRVIKDKANGYTTVDTKFIAGNGQELILQGQFTTYKMTSDIEISVKHFPLYDNIVNNRKLHPVTGKPVESYRFTILDIGTRDGKPNIVKMVKKGRELVMWSNAGAVAPKDGFGNSISTVRSNAKDGYTVHFLGECGYMVRDPRACGELIMVVA